jgi:hypothetical protein
LASGAFEHLDSGGAGRHVDAQWTFDVDAQGAVTQTTLHRNGRDMPAKRLNEAEAKQVAAEIEAHNADVAKRFKEQKQSPGTEAAIRRHIQELQMGEPNYDLMSQQFASVTRAQLAQLKSNVAQFGALQSIMFKGVGPGGADIYEVHFEHAKTEWRISLGPDGKTQGLTFRPL